MNIKFIKIIIKDNMNKHIKIDKERLKKARLEVWITQIELAERVWLTRVWYFGIETWLTNTSKETLEKIVKALNMPRMRGGFRTKPILKYKYNYFLIK